MACIAEVNIRFTPQCYQAPPQEEACVQGSVHAHTLNMRLQL